jgi:hypothetical protein
MSKASNILELLDEAVSDAELSYGTSLRQVLVSKYGLSIDDVEKFMRTAHKFDQMLHSAFIGKKPVNTLAKEVVKMMNKR